MNDGAPRVDAAPKTARDPPSRVAQEAADAYERSRTGGLFFPVVWLLICLTADEHGLREWLIGLGFLVLAGARIAVRLLIRYRPDQHARHLAATLTVMITTMAAWGSATAFALIHPDYAETPTVILFATSAFATAYVHNYPMRLVPCYAGLVAGYGPPFVALLVAPRAGMLPVAIGVFIHFAYLVLAARRAHYEYHRSIDLEHELRAQRDRFDRRSRLDALTGLGNRGEFSERLAEAVVGTDGDDPLTLTILDLDHFKAVNDERGHAVGDACLAAFAKRLRQGFDAPGDLLFRLGGEEFAVLARGARLHDAVARAEVFRADLERRPLDLGNASVPITVSIGVGELGSSIGSDTDGLYRAVDAALYRAKRDGRNRVDCVAPARLESRQPVVGGSSPGGG